MDKRDLSIFRGQLPRFRAWPSTGAASARCGSALSA